MSNVPPPMPGGSSPVAGGNAARWIIDAVIATALCAALFVIYAVDAGGGDADESQADKPKTKTTEVVETSGSQETPQPKKLRIAVTEPTSETPGEPNAWRQFDGMGALLNKLGEGYEYTPIAMDDLLVEGKLREFDVVFLTCGTDVSSWLDEVVGGGDRGATTYTGKQDVMDKLKASLQGFVNKGGTLYASDWRYSVLSVVFPQYLSERLQKGAEQDVEAEIVSPALREFLKADTIRLKFDQANWFPAEFTGEKVQVLLRGNFRTMLGHVAESPLLVQIPHGEGSIIFTSFHNETQNSETELQLLKFLVFTSVTARVETQITKTMVEGGFSPQKQNLLSATSEAPSVTQKYTCDKDGTLRFSLGFENQGARLKLTVTSPDGKTTKEQEGNETISIEIPDPARGEWSYTVEALKVPFEDFPFRLQVWQQ